MLVGVYNDSDYQHWLCKQKRLALKLPGAAKAASLMLRAARRRLPATVGVPHLNRSPNKVNTQPLRKATK